MKPRWPLALLLAVVIAGQPAHAQEAEFQPPPEVEALPEAPVEASPEAPVEASPEAPGEEPRTVPAAEPQREVGRGLASWYGPRFHGRRTASGERFDMHGYTAAHRTLPFGTVVRVRSLVNGRTVDVRINDRGPFLRRRVIDLSRGAAEALGLLQSGTGTKPVVLLVPEISAR